MKLKIYFSTALCLMLTHLSFSGETYLRNWASVLQKANISHAKLYEMCPNFPRFENFKNDEVFGAAVKQWSVAFPAEWNSFVSEKSVKEANPAPLYLGIEADGNHSQEFENGWWEWVKGSNISDARLKEVAAHFPKPQLSGDKLKDQAAYDQQIERWRTLYCHEYEALINAQELTKLNPDYKEYLDVIKVPYYVKGLQTADMPRMQSTGDTFRDELNYQLDLQAWYFLFQPESFEKIFGFPILIDPSFDVPKFRAKVKERLDRQRKIASGELREEDFMKEETQKKNQQK